ncbi:MAG: DUF1553 domain-containing protein, partial [Planctomycetales bacterium]|nr:DUF1553 domain-containing protein [Planctomycetales bacterium]
NNYVHVYVARTAWPSETWRRMVYQMKPRMEQDGVFGAFDCPDASQIAPRRPVSTTALQALNLFNSGFAVEQAERFADRLAAEYPAEPAAQIDRAFWLAFGRAPDDEERQASLAIVDRYGLAAFCRAIYNASEFVYIE